MPALHSALYAGSVMHRRVRPRHHHLRYGVFYMLIDLDEIDDLADRLRLFSHNRFNLFSFHDMDHGNDLAMSPRERIEGQLQEAGIASGGAIRLLTMPRILGYAFNPLSIYFCHRPDGSLSAIIYEVNNTFGERHSYLIPVSSGTNVPIHQESQKAFYVSPFMSTEMMYTFSVVPPADEVAVSIVGRDSEGPLLVARLAASRRDLTDPSLVRAFCTYPFVTVKVTAAIYWEALLIWLKGIRLHERTPVPGQTTGGSRGNEGHSGGSAQDNTNVLR